MNTVKVLDAYLQPAGNIPINGKRVPVYWSLNLLLDRLPPHEDRVYDVIPRAANQRLFVSILDGVADFFLHIPRDETGYGGCVFTIKDKDGNEHKVKGPWSSSCESVNNLGLYPPLVHAAATTSEEDWQRGYTFYSLSGVTEEVVEQALAFLPGWTYIKPSPVKDNPITSGLSDAQSLVVNGLKDGGFYYVPGLPVCPTCDGTGSLKAKPKEPRAFQAARSGEWIKSCPECADYLWSGVAKGYIPGTRRKREETV